MFKRYDLEVCYKDFPIYAASFSSINLLVKFACGFSSDCTFDAYDTVFEKILPIEGLMNEFRSDSNGI